LQLEKDQIDGGRESSGEFIRWLSRLGLGKWAERKKGKAEKGAQQERVATELQPMRAIKCWPRQTSCHASTEDSPANC